MASLKVARCVDGILHDVLSRRRVDVRCGRPPGPIHGCAYAAVHAVGTKPTERIFPHKKPIAQVRDVGAESRRFSTQCGVGLS